MKWRTTDFRLQVVVRGVPFFCSLHPCRHRCGYRSHDKFIYCWRLRNIYSELECVTHITHVGTMIRRNNGSYIYILSVILYHSYLFLTPVLYYREDGGITVTIKKHWSLYNMHFHNTVSRTLQTPRARLKTTIHYILRMHVCPGAQAHEQWSNCTSRFLIQLLFPKRDQHLIERHSRS